MEARGCASGQPLPDAPAWSTNACNHCKVPRKQRRDKKKKPAFYKPDAKSKEDNEDKLVKFGDLITSDHIMALNERSKSRHGDTTAHTCRDRATRWLEGFPAANESKTNIIAQIHQLLGSETCKRWYSDGAPELHAACKDLGVLHDVATPDRHETNGVVERANRNLIEGTACVLFQSGLPHKYWPDAMKCFCQHHNVHHEVEGSKTLWNLRKGTKFEGTLLPFGSKV